ncbi:MAG: hypothetical protein IJ105_01195 [Bacilli bacterium]|nr:hypothetical protein [Bacilli bacterium]
MKAILRSINNFSCKLKQSNNLKYNISPKIRSNKFKNISGNGNVVIEDAIDKNAKDYKIYGNTYQNSTSGKNLFKASSSNYPQGLTITYNSDTGEISFSGTTTGSYPTLSNFTGTNVPPGEYTFSIDKPLPYAIGCRFRNSNGQYPTVVTIPSGELSRTVTVSYNAVRLELVYSVSTSGIQVPQTIIKPMIESGTTATNFEPYTGGQPSPNPDYPQEIISCGDRTKNLFDKDNANVYGGYLSGSGVVSGNGNPSNYDTIVYIECKPNTKYALQKMLQPDTENNRFRVGCTSEIPVQGIQTTNFFKYNDGTTETEYVYTTSSTAKYLLFYCTKTSSITTKQQMFNSIQIEEGNEVTPYEPYYDGYKIPVNVRSDNLINNTLQSQTKNGITLTKNRNGSITANGTATTNTFFDVGKFVQKQNVAYTLNGCPNGGGNSKYRLYILGETTPYFDNGNGVNFPIVNTDTQRTLRLAIYNNMTVENLTFYPMIRLTETGNVKYQPYYNETTNIYLDEPLRKIDGYSDYIDFVNSRVVRNIGDIILNGTQTMYRVNTNTTEIYRFQVSEVPENPTSSTNEIGKILCSHYRKRSAADTYGKHEGISFRNPGVNGFYIYDESRNNYTLEEYKEWLSSNPVTVNYLLATSTEEDIELPNINLIEGKNIITLGTELQGIFDVQYYSKEIIDISDYKYNLRKVED